MNPVKIPLGATALLPLAVSTATAQETGASSKPNFVFIMTDQQRADLCGREGYPLDVTPFVDRMAGEGVWFDRAYTPAPISGPARVAFLTGRFPKATRVKSNHNIEDAVYKDDLFSFARRNGYRTALVGKNHAHLKPQDADCWRPYNHFAQQGRVDEKAKAFNRYLGTTDMYADYDPAPFGPEMQHPWRMVDDALAWIGNGDDKPFMMWFSFPEPHNPYQVSEPYYSMFPPEKLPPMRTDIRDLAVKGPEYELLHEMMSLGHAGYYEHLGRLRSNYHGMIRLIDDQIARFVEQLRKEGLYENTVFVVMSDHGDFAGEYGLMKKGVGLSDIVARVPFVWFGGPVPAQGLSHAHVSLVDVFPTFCEMAGGEIPEGVQGRSLANVIGGGDYPEEEFRSVMSEDGYGGQYYTKEDETDYAREGATRKKPGFFDELNTWTQSGSSRCVRMGDWKLEFDMLGNGRMYNVRKDPSEMKNLYGNRKYAARQQELLAELLKWEIATDDPLPLPRQRYRFKRNPHNYLFCAE